MSERKEAPSLSLQTLAMAIQVIESELCNMKEMYKAGDVEANDDIWNYDLERAAMNLKEVYIHTIETEKVINFPKYDDLVNIIRSNYSKKQ